MKLRTGVVGVFFAALAGMAHGQATNSADITGTVTDATGAVVPGVTITVADLDKVTLHVITSDGAGIYDTGPLVPDDRYNITYTKPGFATLQRGPMTLRVGVIGLNAELAVGQTTQQVMVTEGAPLLETTTSELSATLPAETLTELPQTGAPDWQGFLVLLPGVNGAPQNGNSAGNPGMGGAAANGSLPFSTALLDGASTSSPMSNNVLFTPIFDAIAEVKISDSLFSAQYGIGGMLFMQSSKGGSNQFHGMGYDYLRNSSFNAAPYSFPTGNTFVKLRPPLHYNDLGFNVGGPILKNRVYFFFALERPINHATANPSTISLPTLAMMSGDFTAPGLPTLYDPTTQTIVNGKPVRQTFAAEYNNGNKIPASMIDSVAKNIQAIYPQIPGLSSQLNNYQYAIPTITPSGKYFGRFDADVMKSNRVTGSADWNYQTNQSVTPVCPINCAPVDTFSTNNQLSDVWTISPRVVNEARIGFMGEYDTWSPETYQKGYPAQLGLKYAKADIFPNISITSYYGLASGTHSKYKENLFDLSDVVTLVRGRHVIHAGGELLVERADSLIFGNITSAALSFAGGYTQGYASGSPLSGTGSSYADFLLGYAKSWSAGITPEYGGRLKTPAFFVQDDLKLTPKLTLNLGLRYFGTTGWSEVHGNQRGFDPTILNPATNTLGAMWYASTHTNGRTALQASQFNNWLPRFGAAYQLGNKTTVHGGFGMYNFPWNTDTYGNGQGAALGTSGSESDSTNGVSPVVLLSSDGNTNYQGSAGASINSLFQTAPTAPEAYNGQAAGFTQFHQPVPKLIQWNLSVQRQITNNMVLDVAYVGSHGYNLAYLTDLNQVPQALLGPNDKNSRPYPQFQSITGVLAEGISNYNSLQVQLERRMTNGLQFNFNYTWAHMLDNQDSSGWGSKQGNQPFQDAFHPEANYGASNFDIRNAFKAQGVYRLPFGVGRPFLNHGGLLDEAVGGWLLSMTWVGQTGNPFTVTEANATNSYSQSSNAAWYPNVIGNPRANTNGIHGWFNSAAFQDPLPGTFGNERRNSLYGPDLTQLNASMHKVFTITERVNLDFAANVTNLPNHASFSQPDALFGSGHSAQITGVTVGGRAMEFVGKIRF